MMYNLFSIFDSYSMEFFEMNWFSTFFILFIIPQFYWFFSSNYMNFFINLFNLIIGELKVILFNKFNINNLIYFMVLFLFILFNNFMGLFPYIFTSSSHLMFSMIFSLSMWLGLMVFGWLKNTKFMLIHLVPQGTPFMLMFFMVLIELLSSFIRPMTLCVRLTANMIAGHLLLTLLGDFISNYLIIYLFMFFIQLMLMILEISVSLIQSYVFVILMVLYFKETN